MAPDSEDLGSAAIDRKASSAVTSLRSTVGERLHDLLEGKPGGTLRIGFSGGLDSTVLLDLLANIDLPNGWDLFAAHVNHGIAAQADEWQAQCERVMTGYGLQFAVKQLRIEPAGNLEANAREARYQVFAELACAHDFWLTAHHADDQVETVLLKLLQGRGFKGMSEVSTVNGVSVLRPLLGTSRVELVAYCRERQLVWIEDPSNSDIQFERNYLRARILPGIVSRWPQVREKVAHLLGSNKAIEDVAKFEIDRYRTSNPDGLRVVDLPVESKAAIAWLRMYLEAGGHYKVTEAALTEFMAQVHAAQRARVVWRGGGLEVHKDLIRVLDDKGQFRLRDK